jgi:hypothetical protein
MKFFTSSLIAAACLALSVGAAPSGLVEKDLEARATCNYAYNGNTPDKRGPGQTYGCSKVSWVSNVDAHYATRNYHADELIFG